jgi:hypothetical protein
VNSKPELRARAMNLLVEEPWLSDREIARRVGLAHKTVSRLRAEHGIERAVGPALTAAELAFRAGISERQLRRWRADLLVPDPKRFFVGRRQMLRYPDYAVDRVVAVRDLMVRYRHGDLVVLGLLALGWQVDEGRVRDAYAAWLTRTNWAMEVAMRLINEAPTDASADEAVNWYSRMLRSSRAFAWARSFARAHTATSGQEHDAWEYLGNVSQILVRQIDRTDAELQEILPLDAAPAGLPVDEQLRIARGIGAAMYLPGLLELAASAPMSEIAAGCSDVVLLFVAFVALFDAGFSKAALPPEAKPPLLSDIWGDDPALLAVFGLIFASFKRQTGFAGVQDWIDEMREPTLGSIRFLVNEVAGAAPQLAVFAERYLAHRPGGA